MLRTLRTIRNFSTTTPINPFHLAFPVHDLAEARQFYGNILGCTEGRRSKKWQDYNFHGHQIVCHLVDSSYRHVDYFNPVSGDDVPVPHFGVALSKEDFDDVAERLKKYIASTPDHEGFIVEPTLRFPGEPGEQHTMFIKDPSGNNLEFKAMAIPENLFAKYETK